VNESVDWKGILSLKKNGRKCNWSVRMGCAIMMKSVNFKDEKVACYEQ
jgi:hypothetical protein